MLRDPHKIMEENRILRDKIADLEAKLQELDRQIFYLNTLYDLNREIAPLENTNEILKAFLMMILGTFGVFQGFLLLVDKQAQKIDCFESRSMEKGFFQPVLDFFENGKWAIFSKKTPLACFDQKLSGDTSSVDRVEKEVFEFLLSKGVSTVLPFSVDERYCGAIALGERITGEPFSQIDRELLSTFAGQLVINIANAKSFEIIKGLNEDLKNKNKALEDTLAKIQLLEKAKALLCKFVPKSLERLIDAHPDFPDLEKKYQDISVLFLDIEGYTAISEGYESVEITRMLETYFSCFLDDIHRFSGDINMSLGDGLMILFQDKDKKKHVLNAVKTALAIKHKAEKINQHVNESVLPFVINIGIHSGTAFVGASRLDGYYGSRWTYTALGPTVNIAARIGSFAKNGEILVSDEIASRVKNEFTFEHLGFQQFKNLTKKISIYRVIPPNFT